MEISVIIPTYNRSKIVNKTIRNTWHILSKLNIDFEIIVINDGNEDVLQTNKNILIRKNIGKGVASARNYGASLAKYNFLLFLDDDILISDEAAKYLIEFFNSYKSSAYCLNISWIYPTELIVQCQRKNFGRYLLRINYVSMKGWMNSNTWKEQSQYETETLASYFLAITKENFFKTDGYNEKFPYSGFEDYEFAQRANAVGIKTLLNTKYIVYHNEEDRLDINDWMLRRYREGITRALYVKLTNDAKYNISHNIVKRIIYNTIYFLRKPIIFNIKLLNTPLFDFITHKLIHVLTGAYIWKGFSHEMRKKD